MKLDLLMGPVRDAVLDDASGVLAHVGTGHYRSAPEGEVRRWLGDLYDLVWRAVADRSLAEVDAYARRLARRRYESGFTLVELQRALNEVERAVWAAVVGAADEAGGPVRSLGLLSTAFGAVKDAVAREYVELVGARHAPAIDVDAVATGAFG